MGILRSEEKYALAREQRLGDLMKSCLKVMVTLRENFKDKTREELDSMQKNIGDLIKELKAYEDLLTDIASFNEIWKIIKSEDNYAEAEDLYSSRIQEALYHAPWRHAKEEKDE